MTDDASPYAPPRATLDEAVGERVFTREQVDPAEGLAFAFRGPRWGVDSMVMGMVSMVPLVGMATLLGWCRRVFDDAAAGRNDGLPPLDLVGDTARGVAPLVGLSVGMGAPFALLVATQVLGLMLFPPEEGQQSTLGTLVMLALTLGMVVGILLMMALMPELLRQSFRGRLNPWLGLVGGLRAVVKRPLAYAIVAVMWLFIYQFSTMGLFFCFIGVFWSWSLSWAVVANLAGQWEAVVRGTEG